MVFQKRPNNPNLNCWKNLNWKQLNELGDVSLWPTEAVLVIGKCYPLKIGVCGRGFSKKIQSTKHFECLLILKAFIKEEAWCNLKGVLPYHYYLITNSKTVSKNVDSSRSTYKTYKTYSYYTTTFNTHF